MCKSYSIQRMAYVFSSRHVSRPHNVDSFRCVRLCRNEQSKASHVRIISMNWGKVGFRFRTSLMSRFRISFNLRVRSVASDLPILLHRLGQCRLRFRNHSLWTTHITGTFSTATMLCFAVRSSATASTSIISRKIVAKANHLVLRRHFVQTPSSRPGQLRHRSLLW